MKAIFPAVTGFSVVLSLCSLGCPRLCAAEPLTEQGDLVAKMVAGIHKYLDREIAASVEKRQAFWSPDVTSVEAYRQSIAPNRERLRKYLGAVDERLPPRLEYVGGPGEPAQVAETATYTVHTVRWAVLPGVDGEGLLLEPKGKAIANVVAIPDAGQTPERIAGLLPAKDARGQFARRLAESGCRVLVPVLIDRGHRWSMNERLKKATNISHREFVHRMAFEMGRTLVGYEVQKVLGGVAWFRKQFDTVPVGLYGYGEGGRVALYAAALDDTVSAVVVSGAFGPREGMASEPLDRNLWGVLTEFGDAEILRLIFPRPAIVEGSRFHVPEPRAVAGRTPHAAPGHIDTATAAATTVEMNRGFAPLLDKWKLPRTPSQMIFGATLQGDLAGNDPATVFRGPGFPEVLASFLKALTGTVAVAEDGAPAPTPRVRAASMDARQKRQFDQLVAFTQKLWRESEPVRKALFTNADASSPEAWDKSVEPLRERFHTEVIGKLPEPTMPLNPRMRPIYDEPSWTGQEVMLDVYPDVFAYGILLMPKDLKPGEKRPVVVCQHGLSGTPQKVIEPEAKRIAYDQFARKLVEKGYIVYAPQNPYNGEVTFRQINRKAYPLKLSLFSFIIRQHQRTLDWLETLPNVDAKRIAFYGLSYGGKTAMRVPAVEKRYCLSICSGDFNEWIGKMVSVELDRSYMWTKEYEMFEFDLGSTFSYAEMAALIAPRPFMVERGHDDGVGTDEMVAYEFAKVRYLYQNRLKLTSRSEIEFFVGGHRIHGVGTFAFLDRHLK